MINVDKFYNLEKHYTFNSSAEAFYRIEFERTKKKNDDTNPTLALRTLIIDGRPQTRLSVFKD